jgi:hypothetical protein
MRRALRIFTLILVLAAAACWLAAGANLGWTKTSVPLKTVDEVTGLDHIEWQRRFVPGIDFLAATLVAAIVLAGASFAFRDKSIET